MPPISTTSNTRSSAQFTGNYQGPLAVLTSLFFIWAFVTNLNDILIPHLKKACELTDFQSSLVQSAFFGAYFVMSLPSGWVVKKLGYKRSILVGLFAMLVGALLFIPAAYSRQYLLFLSGLFILASGVTLLQVAANPFVSVLGPPEKASSRLNMTQAFNSLGAALAPFLGGLLILSGKEFSADELAAMIPADRIAYLSSEALSVVWPYIGLSVVLVLLMALIHFSNLPEIDEDLEQEEEGYLSGYHAKKTSVWQYSHLVWGVVAIFFYVGAEVAIASFLIKYAKELLGLAEADAKNFPSYYMVFAMAGRFAGAALLRNLNPARTVGFNAVANILMVAAAITLPMNIGVWALVLMGLFNSIMFPTIFTESIRDLGKFTKAGSSLLIMAIVGGAIIPPLTGLAFDYCKDHGISQVFAFLVPGASYLAVVWFGFVGHKIKA